jgi:hypothetical protein
VSLRDDLLAQRERSAARYGPDGMAVIEGAIEELRVTGLIDVPGIGDRAPLFTLPSARGDEIALGDLLGRRAVVLSFYRGGW